MPIPKPRKGEAKSDFISRFMSNNTMKNEYPNKDQRLAVANSTWSKNRGENKQDWKIIEFLSPIQEVKEVEEGKGKKKEFLIRGMAINETTSRNGVRYIAKELERAAPTFRNKPIMTDHSNSVKDIVGRTTEKVAYNPAKGGIEFEAKIMDERIKEMVNDGRISDVSIGASLEDVEKNEEEGYVIAKGIEGLEISLVAIPGDPNANIAMAIQNSFDMKKQNKDTLIKLQGGNKKMAEEEKPQEQPEEKQEEEQPKEETENKQEQQTSENEVAKLKEELETYKKKERMEEEKKKQEKLKEDMKQELLKELKAEMTPPKEAKEDASEEEEKSTEPEDKTKGEVKSEGEDSSEDNVDESLVVERAESGNGFAMYRDVSKLSEDSGFKRLIR